MNRYARTAPGQTLEIIPTRRPFSFFNFVETRFKEYQPLRRILSQVRMHDDKTMVIEELDKPADLNEENQDLRKRNPDFAPASSRAYRLSFFTKEFPTKPKTAAFRECCGRGSTGAPPHSKTWQSQITDRQRASVPDCDSPLPRSGNARPWAVRQRQRVGAVQTRRRCARFIKTQVSRECPGQPRQPV